MDAYRIIQTSSKEITDRLQKRFESEIKNDFQDSSKAPYQNAKRDTFESVTFSIKSSRAKGSDIDHTNIICLDIDENTHQELIDFRQKVLSNQIDFARACALSVSGRYNGSMWLNVACDVTSVNYSDHKELFKLLNLFEGSDRNTIIEKVHKAYTDLIQFHLSKMGIIFGTSSKTLKQPRYLSHDPDIYINLNAKVFTLDELLMFKRETTKRKRAIQKKSIVSSAILNERTWADLCEKFAEDKLTGNNTDVLSTSSTDFIDNKRMFCFYFGCQANKLGIYQAQAIEYIQKKFDEHSLAFTQAYKDQLTSAYENYEDSWRSSARLLHKIDECTIDLEEGQRLNDKAQEIDVLLSKHGRIELIADCGIGKNYASVHGISSGYKAKHNEPTVIIVSLNQKAKKDAKQYNLPYLTGERLNESLEQGFDIWGEIDESDVILCNQNQFPKLALRLKSQGKKCRAILDEVQTVTKAYKEDTSKELLSALEMSAREIMVMTGTPKDYFGELGFKRVRVNSKHDPINTIIRKSEKNWLLNLGRLYTEYKSEDKIILAKCNNKKALGTARDYLTEHFDLSPEQVLIIHSDISKSERDVFEDKLNNDKVNSFEDHVKIVLVTSVINEGIDIYSEREIITVSFERTGYFVPDELIQFAGRWRVKGKAKTLICYFPITDHPNKGFNTYIPSYQFHELYNLYNDICTGLNSSLSNSHHYSEKALISLKNRFSDECKFIYYDKNSNSYKPDTIACMLEIEKTWLSKCTCLEGIEFIKNNFPYFNFEFQDEEEVTFSEQEQEITQRIQEDEKINRKKAKEMFLELYQIDKTLLFQAILRASSDPEINNSVKRLISYNDKANVLIQKMPVLFNKYLSIGKQLVKRDAKLRHFLSSDNDRETIMFDNNTITSEQKFSDFLTGIKLHVLLMLWFNNQTNPEKGTITREQNEEGRRLMRFITDYPLNDFYSQDEIVKLVTKHYRRNGKHFKVTKQNAMCLVRTFFEIEMKRFGGQNKINKYAARKVNNLDKFLLASGLKDVSQIKKEIEENINALL